MTRRMTNPFRALLLGLALATVAPAGAVPTVAQPAALNPFGRWLNPAGDVEVSVAPCGALLCGTVTWVGGQALADASDAGVQHLVGTQLLQGYRRQDPGNWQGQVFVPDMGSTFFSRIHQPDDGHLKISGCILHGLLCKSQIWTRR